MFSYTVSIAAVLLIIAATVIISNSEKTAISDIVDVRYASVPAIVEAPAHIAYAKGFFYEEGLDVEMKLNPDGKTSLDQLFAGTVDIASVMATHVVFRSFERDDFYRVFRCRA